MQKQLTGLCRNKTLVKYDFSVCIIVIDSSVEKNGIGLIWKQTWDTVPVIIEDCFVSLLTERMNWWINRDDHIYIK